MSARIFRAKSKLKDFLKKVWKPLCHKGLRGVERETLKFTFCVYMHLWQKMAKWYIKFFICGWENFKPQDVVFREFGWMVWWNGEIDDNEFYSTDYKVYWKAPHAKSQEEYAKKIWDYLINEEHLTKEQASAIMGNAMQESGMGAYLY